MVERPTDFPVWADNPLPGQVTAPTSLEREQGWPAASLPALEIDNWRAQLTQLWLRWLDQSVNGLAGLVFRQGAVLPVGTPPTVSAGLVRAPGNFSAGVMVDGNLVGPVPSPGVTLTATRRHFWDLGADGVWTHITTLLADPTPAVTADSVRVFVFTTDGAGINAVTVNPIPDRSALGGDALSFEGVTAIGADRDGTPRDALEPALTETIPADGLGASYQLIREWNVEAGNLLGSVGWYLSSTGGGPRRLVLVVGARQQGGAGNPWLADIDAPTRMDLMGGRIYTSTASGVLAGATFNDAAWNDETASELRTLVRSLRHLAFGDGTLPAIEADRAGGSNPYAFLYRHREGSPASTVAIYSGPEPGGAASSWGLMIAVGAEIERTAPGSGAYRWRRPTGLGGTSRLFHFSRLRGLRVYAYGGGSDTWANLIDESTAWSEYESITVRLSGIAGSAPGWGSLNGASAAAPVPGNPWSFSRVVQGTGGDAGAWWELTPDLVPEGAILDSFAVNYSKSAGQPGSTNASVCRHAIGGTSPTLETLRSGANYTTEDLLPDAPAGTVSATYALGASQLDRTVVRAGWRYGLLIRSLVAGSSAEIHEVYVTFRRRRVLV